MNFADIENVWRSAHNRPTAEQLERDRAGFVADLRRRRRSFLIFLSLVVGVLILVTGRFAVHALWGGPTAAPVSARREWGALLVMALPWVAVLVFGWQQFRHRRRHGVAGGSISASVRALLDENRLARLRLGWIAALHAGLLILTPIVVHQLRAVGKAGDEILVPALVIWPAISAGILGGLFYHDRRTLRPRKQQLEALLQRHRAATGTESALTKVSTRRASGWIERNRTKVPFVQSQRAPNLLRAETRFPRPGTLVQGFDGAVGWVLHPQQGGRKLAGRELAATAAAAWFHPGQHLTELFPVRRWGGERRVEGRAQRALELAAGSGEPAELWWFDEGTARLAAIEKTVDGGPQGLVPVTLTFEDYRETDGLTLAYRVRTRVATVETVLQFETIEHGVTFPAGFFTAPF